MLHLKLFSSVEEVRHFKSVLKKFYIYSKIDCRDAENFFRHQCELVLRHQMQVSNYFLKFFYSVAGQRARALRAPSFLRLIKTQNRALRDPYPRLALHSVF
jgi:hypothetical protein